ncbi:MAG: histidine kinase [Saprospiraceae bacterium]|nr:histidine kinase [Saprospiraceae bacterium]MCF8251808.1 histidine kinase [Saprospiraceae bacterium]MCF8281462.1 histidine kinase [Bacteroidales bacterium]MCF8313522.1 histidine kinase [Saprospiraceae bacterium]MCF8442255.1 histidine kinase [Saprospiraceae bacterium]
MRCLFLLLFLSGRLMLSAQLPQYHAQVFGAAQGISGGSIEFFFKDRQQFLWVGAGDVLQRFDGRNVYKYQFENNVMQALCDRDNRVWALVGSSIFRTCTDRWGFEPVPHDTASIGIVRIIFQLEERPVYALTSKGLFGWDEKKGAFQSLPISLPPPLFSTGSLRFDVCESTIFYPGKNCIHAADLATGKVRTVEVWTPYVSICALTPDLAVWSYFNDYSFWLDFNLGTKTPVDAMEYGLSNWQHFPGIHDAVPVGDSLFLVTTKFGICTYDLRSDRFTRQRIFAEGKPIDLDERLFRLFSDDNGTFWTHNQTNVVAFRSLENTIGLFRNYHDEEPLKWNSNVIGFTEDSDGNIWFGGFHGFNKLDLKTGQVAVHAPGEDVTDRLSHPSVRGMAFAAPYVVLGPTGKGVWLYNPAADSYRRPKITSDSVAAEIENDFISGILLLRNGDFVVCAKKHTYLLRAKSYLLDFLQFPGNNTNIVGACQDSTGRIWLGSTKGVYVLDEQLHLQFSIPTDQKLVWAIAQNGNDEMLLGTSNGLFRLSPASAAGVISKVDSPIGNSHATIIYQDHRQRFWFGTSDGLFLADSSLGVFRRFDFADNIQSLFYHPHAMLRASNGLLFLGGQNGINYFYPEKIELESQPLAPTLQTLTIGDGDSVIWNPQPDLVFSHEQNTLTFEVVAPYFNNAGKLQYRYRLEDNGPWVSTNGSGTIRLANLPLGKHQLELAASLSGSQWYAAPPFNFRIQPAFWQTPLFFGFAAAAAICLLWFFIRRREAMLKKRQLQALELERLKASALQARLQSLRLQMNPHFLFNSLNSIQELIMTGNSDGAATYLSKFSKLLRLVLAHSDHEMVSLREEIGMLRLYLELESLRFADSFEYSIEHEPSLDLNEYKLPTLLIQPFVENAIWHGLLHKEGMRRLFVRFETDIAEHLVCIVEDNGVGRTAAQKTNGNGKHQSKGMSAGLERLEALNSRHQQHNSLEIIDLVSEDGTPIGTKVMIKLA